LWVLVLAFALGLVKAEAVVGAVGKWESRAFGEISKGVWEPVKTCLLAYCARSVPKPIRLESLGWLFEREQTRVEGMESLEPGQIFRNQQVAGSSPAGGSMFSIACFR
jgi:hypothetical protein